METVYFVNYLTHRRWIYKYVPLYYGFLKIHSWRRVSAILEYGPLGRPSLFAFSRPAFAAKLKVAELLSEAGVGCATYQKLQTTLATVR